MQRTKGERPADWPMYHDVDFKEPPINVDFMSEDEDGDAAREEDAEDENSDN